MKKWYVICGILALVCLISLSACASNSSEVDRLEGELADVKADLTAKESELADARAQLEAVRAELAQAEQVVKELETKYPPRDFWSVEELVEWLAKDTTDKLAQVDPMYDMGDAAARLSDNAMEDGYVLSLCPLKIAEGEYYCYQLQNCAIISGSAYLVNPMTDEVKQLGGSGIYGDRF